MEKVKNKKTKKSDGVLAGVIAALLIVQCVGLIIPFLWSLLTTVKLNVDLVDGNWFGLPRIWKFEQWASAFTNIAYENKTFNMRWNLMSMVFNSLAFAGVGAFTTTTVTFLVAYVRNFYQFKFLKVLDVIVMFVITVPIVGSLPSSLELFTKLNLINNFFGMTVIAKISFCNTYYFIIGAVIKSVSGTYVEAAEIDGANQMQIFLKIMLPLTFSIYLTVYVFQFIGLWNDYQTSWIYLRNFPTASFGLWYYKNMSAGGSTIPYKLAGSFIVLIPMLILFFLFKKNLMTGLSFDGGIKD